MILGLWVLIYLAYFIYFLVVQGRETTFIQEIAIYAIAQGVAGCLYLCAILTELRRGIFLWSDLNKYEKILTGVQLNKTRVIHYINTVFANFLDGYAGQFGSMRIYYIFDGGGHL